MSRHDLPPPGAEEQAIIDRCKLLGVDVNHLGDFISYSYKKGVDINEPIAKLFADELDKNHDKNLIAILMHAGESPEFRDIMLPAIVKVLRREGDNYTGGDAINSLNRITLPKDSPLIGELLLEKNIGGQRGMLVPIYARLARKSAIPILRKAIRDPDTHVLSLHHLSILGDTTIAHELLQLSNHPDAWRRKIARDGLKRVEKNKLKQIKPNAH
jgi:hypothetical protein